MQIPDRDLCRSTTDLLVLFDNATTCVSTSLALPLLHRPSPKLRQYRNVPMPLLVPHAKVRYNDNDPLEIV